MENAEEQRARKKDRRLPNERSQTAPPSPVVGAVVQRKIYASTQVGKTEIAGRADPDRTAAVWALSMGGTLAVSRDGNRFQATSVEALPATPFQVESVDLPMNRERVLRLSDLQNLQGLTSLVYLNLAHNPITEGALEPISKLNSLESLNVWNTTIADKNVAHLKGLTNLRFLNIGANRLTDAALAHLRDMKKLTELHLQMLRIQGDGLTVLREFPNLEIVSLWRSNVNDTHVELLGTLQQLKNLNVEFTEISPSGAERLKTMLPNCQITWQLPTSTAAGTREKVGSQ
jgi:Leucine-rich repeat (LRR) protein